MLHNIKLLNSFTKSFTATAVPHMLSSVLTDAMQRLPSAVNSYIESNKYQYMFVEKPLYNKRCTYHSCQPTGSLPHCGTDDHTCQHTGSLPPCDTDDHICQRTGSNPERSSVFKLSQYRDTKISVLQQRDKAPSHQA